MYEGYYYSEGFGKTEVTKGYLLYKGLTEGYHTMDLIASFFFTSTVIAALREVSGEGVTTKSIIRMTLKSCAVGIILLAVVYVGLVSVAAANAHILTNVPKHELLSVLVTHLLGPELQIVATLAVVLACLTTSVALQMVYADYLTELFKGRISLKTGMLITLGVTYGVSNLGFEGISRLTGPILEVFYPILLLLIVWKLAIKPLLKSKKADTIAQLETP